MLNALRARLHQGHRTLQWPDVPAPVMPERYRGLLAFHPDKCSDACRLCADACPTDAIRPPTGPQGQGFQLDLGACLFCGACEAACPTGALHHTRDWRMAASDRAALHLTGQPLQLAGALDEKLRKLFGRSLKLRQVSAGGCNACEGDASVLTTIGFDIQRFGIDFVASPRHADGLLVTGPVTENMKLALQKTWDAVPAPKIVIAMGACAISGGPYAGHPEVHGGAESVVPVDLWLPGCPPHPLTVLDGLLRMLDRLPAARLKDVMR
ncbi:MAG: 4Fe-4S dicluster domain-containing protein [Myxococcales bacterium]|nr:4Fe-4S dicluster domain-containing protein [Myxococcales bacterium]